MSALGKLLGLPDRQAGMFAAMWRQGGSVSTWSERTVQVFASLARLGLVEYEADSDGRWTARLTREGRRKARATLGGGS